MLTDRGVEWPGAERGASMAAKTKSAAPRPRTSSPSPRLGGLGASPLTRSRFDASPTSTSPRPIWRSSSAARDARRRPRTPGARSPDGDGARGAELQALEERMSRGLQQVQEKTDRLLAVVLNPLEAKVGALEGRFPVLDYKIAEVGERVESMRREVDKHGDTGAEHLQDALRQAQEEAAHDLRAQMVDLVTQEVSARVRQEVALMRWSMPEGSGISPASAFGRSLRLETSRLATASLEEAHAEVEESLRDTADGLLRGLEETADLLREELEGAAGRASYGEALADDDRLASEVRRLGEELGALKEDVRYLVGSGGPPSAAKIRLAGCGPSQLSMEEVAQIAKQVYSESREQESALERRRAGGVFQAQDHQPRESPARGLDLEPVRTGLAAVVSRVRDLECLPARLREITATIASLEAGAAARKDAGDAAQHCLEELTLVREDLRKAATQEELRRSLAGLPTRKDVQAASAGVAELQDRVGRCVTQEALEAFRAQVVTKEMMQRALACAGASAQTAAAIVAPSADVEGGGGKACGDLARDRSPGDNRGTGPGKSRDGAARDQPQSSVPAAAPREPCASSNAPPATPRGAIVTEVVVDGKEAAPNFGIGGHAAPQKALDDDAAADRPLARGSPVLFRSITHSRWMDAVVENMREDGAIMVDVKQDQWITPEEQEMRVRRLGAPIFREGEYVQYMSPSWGAWIDGEVVAEREKDGAVMLDVREGQWLGIEEQLAKLRYPSIIGGVVVKVLRDIMSDSDDAVLIKRGTRGVVQKIDADGDALLDLDGHRKSEWVFKGKLDDLRAIGSGGGSIARPVAEAVHEFRAD